MSLRVKQTGSRWAITPVLDKRLAIGNPEAVPQHNKQLVLFRFSTNVEQLENRGYRPTAHWFEKQLRMCLASVEIPVSYQSLVAIVVFSW